MKLLPIILLLSFTAQSQIQKDKVYHTAAGFVISAGTGYVSYKLGASKTESILIGFGAGVAAGVAKEIWDMNGNGTPSFADALWTAVGSGLGSVTLTFTINEKTNHRNQLHKP